MKKLIVLLIVAMSFMFSCEQSGSKIQSFEIDKNEIIVGEIETLNINLTPNNSSMKSFTITSSSECIEITNNIIKGISEGNATIVIKVEDTDGSIIEKSFELIVKNKPVELKKITINGADELECGNESLYTITIEPKEYNLKELVWELSDNSLATIENGLLKTNKAGTLTIKAYDKQNPNIFGEKNVAIKEIKVDDNELLDEFVSSVAENILTTDLPNTYDKYKVTYQMDKVVDQDGKITKEEFDTEVSGKIIFEYNEEKYEKDVKLLVEGFFIDTILEAFKKTLPNKIDKRITFNTSYDLYDGTRVLINESNKPEYLTKQGIYERPFHDEIVTLKLNIRTTTPKASKFVYFDVVVEGQSIDYKAQKSLEKICETYPENSIIYFDEPVLPEVIDEYDCTIKWFDEKGNDLNFSKIAQDPVLGNTQVLRAKVSCRGEETTKTLDYLVWNKKYNNDEEKIDDFVKAMNFQNIGTYKYKSGAYYENNWGYVPFIDEKIAERNLDHMLPFTYGKVRTGIKKTSTEYIVIHDTAGGAPTHTAESFALNQVISNNKEDNTEISWHFTVGEDGIYQSLPLDEVAWHAGDGSRVYGTTYFNTTYQVQAIGGGNRNGIGIESCINFGADYNVTLRKLAKLVAELLLEFDLSFDRIKQHNNFSGKDCPGVIRHTGRWEEFKNLVKLEYFLKTQLKGYTFTYKSLTPKILDDTGKVINQDKQAKIVQYEVTVQGEQFNKKYEFTSNILAWEDWSHK